MNAKQRGRVIRTGALAICAALALASCDSIGGRANQITYEGIPFKGKSKAIKGDRMSFVASAKPASRSIEGAIQAATYEGVKYCIARLGSSDITWQIGPDTPREQLVVQDDTLTFRGTCAE
ncbi:hypothetical protein [Salipiger sp.]|uniref:hypothetical protein n=1 Tax=Salipiger sp. TaxID=2078585 RepID=UPI003A980034